MSVSEIAHRFAVRDLRDGKPLESQGLFLKNFQLRVDFLKIIAVPFFRGLLGFGGPFFLASLPRLGGFDPFVQLKPAHEIAVAPVHFAVRGLLDHLERVFRLRGTPELWRALGDFFDVVRRFLMGALARHEIQRLLGYLADFHSIGFPVRLFLEKPVHESSQRFLAARRERRALGFGFLLHLVDKLMIKMHGPLMDEIRFQIVRGLAQSVLEARQHLPHPIGVLIALKLQRKNAFGSLPSADLSPRKILFDVPPRFLQRRIGVRMDRGINHAFPETKFSFAVWRGRFGIVHRLHDFDGMIHPVFGNRVLARVFSQETDRFHPRVGFNLRKSIQIKFFGYNIEPGPALPRSRH